jgi:hypothetical protein
MNKLSDCKQYNGVDADLATSLYEYGLIWAKGIEGHENDYHFIYGVTTDDAGNYNLFDWADIAIDTDIKAEYNWISENDWQHVLSSVDMDEKEFFSMPLPWIINDLISYYGHENIMGSSYYPFTIAEEA